MLPELHALQPSVRTNLIEEYGDEKIGGGVLQLKKWRLRVCVAVCKIDQVCLFCAAATLLPSLTLYWNRVVY
jgi:hypothetical protein